ncbi:MAG TPA: hypothetical protein VEG30_09315 [Terriglobales bacterium]|nr:hypothetical protein [Terriglobales bacterium]
MFATALRLELNRRNQEYAQVHRLPHQLSYGAEPTVAYEPSADALRHGNFLDASYAAILAKPDWKRRLNKPHSQSKSSLPRSDRRWRELDSCNSSDALLMNVFCYPCVCESSSLIGMMGVELGCAPQFGMRARVPLLNGRFDRTEVDMRLGNLLVESKLTEPGFQQKTKKFVQQYRDFDVIFQRSLLPQTRETYLSYQLLRNVMAAHATGDSFCVITDARRPDLIEAWFLVVRAVKPGDLRRRCKVLTWQELAEALPVELRSFLGAKYGIVVDGQQLPAREEAI